MTLHLCIDTSDSDIWNELIHLEDAVELLSNASAHPKLHMCSLEHTITVGMIRDLVTSVQNVTELLDARTNPCAAPPNSPIKQTVSIHSSRVQRIA